MKTDDDLSRRINEFWDRVRSDGEQVLTIAKMCGWDDAEYYAMCEYDPNDAAWYPKNGSDYSIWDHAADWLDENIHNTVTSFTQPSLLEGWFELIASHR